MGVIVDQWGNTNKLIEGSVRQYNRPYNSFPRANDFDTLVTEWDHSTLVSKSRKLYSNTPYVRAIIQQKAMFSTRNGWNVQSLSTDKEWKRQATDYLNKFFKVACTNGMDFNTFIYSACVCIDRDGDFFAALTTSKNNFPQLQILPSYRVATRNGESVVQSGTFKGFKIVKGIIVNEYGREIGINVLGDADDGSQDRQLAAQDYIHIFEPDYPEAVRGTPMISHAINTIADMNESIKRELTSMLIHASVSLVENLTPLDDEISNLTNEAAPMYEEFQDGLVKVYRGGPDSKLAPFESQRPSPNWREFHQMLLRQVCVSCNWSESLLDGKGETSVQNRINLRVAELSVGDRISLLFPFMQRIVSWVTAKAIKDGNLPASEDFYKWTFSRPPFITAEITKVENSTRENLKLGITTMSQILSEQGRNLYDHEYEKYEERAISKLIKAEVEAKYGVTLDDTPEEEQVI